MATGVNFMIFEKRFFSEFNDVSHVIIDYIRIVKIFFFLFNLKINKQLSLKTVSIINLFTIKMPYLSETERIEVLMMIGYGDRRQSCAEVMTLLMTHKK
jgi:hypothetical protein